MTATGHAIVGTVIAAKIGNPALALPLALASHVVTDAMPHWDTGTNRIGKSRRRLFIDAAMDVGLGFLLSYLLIIWLFPQTNLSYAFLLIVVSQLPDWLTAPYYFFHIKLFKWAYSFQKLFDNELDLPWGLVTQATVLILSIILARGF